MKTEEARPSWEDVVFESRNKEYGAYAIRKSYHENISKASLIALLFAAFVFGVMQIASLLDVKIKMIPPIPKNPIITISPLVIPDPVKKSPVSADQKINKRLLERVVKREVIEPPPVIPLDVTATGSVKGMPSDLVGGGEPAVGQGPDGVPIVIEPHKIFDTAEVMPQYEGGLKAMSRFISKHIHYPPPARATGQEGTVFVRFVVNDHGQVVDVEVIKGVSATLDKEAMRVIAMMNKWKPGLQHHLPVNVRMVLPIKFQLEQ